MESYSDWREENNLDEMHGGTMSKLGPREKGRKDKGKKKPQAIRQAKARTKALKQKLNTEEIDVEEGFKDFPIKKVNNQIDKKKRSRKSMDGVNAHAMKAVKNFKTKRWAMMDADSEDRAYDKSVDHMNKRDSSIDKAVKARKAGNKKEVSKNTSDALRHRKREKGLDSIRIAARNQHTNSSEYAYPKESYSDWRSDLVDLRELVVGNPPPAAMDKDIATNATPKTDTKAREEIKEKPVNNKVKINPTMRESFEALGGEVLEVVDLTEERAKTREEARRKLEANRKAIEAGRPEDSPYGKHLRKKLKSPSEYGKDPWSTHASDAKAHAKEETELDERSLTDGEKDEKEKYVMGMKKSVDGFKKRYGDRAKSVMYATATKMAKEGYDMDMAADVFIECGFEYEEFYPVLESVILGGE